MLFKQYANPFDFLDGISQMGMFEQGILKVIEDEQEQKLWELYLHSYPEKSFKEWKDSLKSSNPKNAMTESEVATQVQKSKNLLKSFNPTKGGKA